MDLLHQVPFETSIVHGTSLEAVIKLLNYGCLPKTENNFFYFQAIFNDLNNFEKKPISFKEDNEVFSKNQFYAMNSAIKHYLINQLGYLPEWYHDAAILHDLGESVETNWTNFLKREKVSNSLVNEICAGISQRRGILLIPQNNFLRKYTYEIIFPDNDIRVNMPLSLKIEDIAYIVPQGDFEMDVLKKMKFK